MKKTILLIALLIGMSCLCACTKDEHIETSLSDKTDSSISNPFSNATENWAESLESTDSETMELSATESPTTDIPATDPPATDPPETEPPVTEPSTIKAPATDPPTTNPPIYEPTVSEPATSEPSTTKPASGHKHTYTETVVAPTCTEEGYTLHTCFGCGKTYKSDKIHERGHLYGDWKYLITATLTREGYREAECRRCGYVHGGKVAKLNPAYAHKYENIDERIVIKTNGNGAVSYFYYPVSVVDTRSWGGTATIRIKDNGGYSITYYKQDGTEVSCSLNPVEGYINRLVILEDGSYTTGLIGDFKD